MSELETQLQHQKENSLNINNNESIQEHVEVLDPKLPDIPSFAKLTKTQKLEKSRN